MIPAEGTKMTAGDELLLRLDRAQTVALVLGGAGLVVSLGAWVLVPEHFFTSYLVGYLFWIGITLGSIGLTMLHHLSGGSWGLVIRRPLEAGATTALALALLFLPIAFGLDRLFPWAVSGSPSESLVVEPSPYLNRTFFLIRAAGYFAVWIAMALGLAGLSSRQDLTTDQSPTRWLQRLSGPGSVLLFLTATFSAIDWGMSREPQWASTIYGPMLITGDAMATFALMIVVTAFLAQASPMSEIATPGRLNDLGNLLLAFVMLWAYMSFCQYLIVWSGNLTEEIPWYLRRTRGGWQWFALALVACQFFLPFFVLLFREFKRDPRYLLRITLWILVMRWVEMVWLVIPASFDPASPQIPWIEVPLSAAATVGIGGIWTWFFIGRLKRGPLVPLADPNLVEALRHSGD
jgi:hypothetical protein